MNVRIEIDIDDAYSELSRKEGEEFINEHLDDASDEAIIDEFKRRGLTAEDLE